jgi:hypothetical protein
MSSSTTEDAMRWYPSKVDWWLRALLWMLPLSGVATLVGLAATGKTADLAVGLASVAFLVVLYFGLLIPVTYGLGDDQLVVRFGMVRHRIPLRDLLEVYPTRNPLSAPALSLDRLHVQYGLGFFEAVMISPADRDGFLEDLARRAGMSRDGDRLRRT